MDREQNIARFESEFSKINRAGADKLLEYIRSSDMYTAPASTRFHLHVEGGLLQHSLNVLDALRSSLTLQEDGTYAYVVAGKVVTTVTEENVVVMALLHDLCKTNLYEPVKKFRKDKDNKWEEYLGYEVKDRSPYGHGEKSVMMIEQYMQLKKIERYAIRWHMGFPEGSDRYTFNDAVKLYPIIWAVHNADMAATSFMEDMESNKEKYCE